MARRLPVEHIGTIGFRAHDVTTVAMALPVFFPPAAPPSRARDWRGIAPRSRCLQRQRSKKRGHYEDRLDRLKAPIVSKVSTARVRGDIRRASGYHSPPALPEGAAIPPSLLPVVSCSDLPDDSLGTLGRGRCVRMDTPRTRGTESDTMMCLHFCFRALICPPRCRWFSAAEWVLGDRLWNRTAGS